MVNERREVEFFSGPLPPPEKLEQYNHIIPNGADRILAMAERQSAHRIDIESEVIASDIQNSKLGLIFGFVITMAGIGVGGLLIYSGQTLVGSLFAGGTLASLVGSFLRVSSQRRREREENQKLLQK